MQENKKEDKNIKEDRNNEGSTRNNLMILYIGEILDSKGDKLIRIKRKIYDEIMLLREEDHQKINNTINSILAAYLFNAKNKK